MSASAWALQKALYAHLAADAGVLAELGDPPRIHDEAPPGAALPHVVLGEGSARPVPGLDGGVEHEIRLLVHSRHQGRREVKRIIDVLHDALHDAAFAVEGASLVNIRHVFSDVFRRSDDGTYLGVARFRAVTQEESE